MHKYPANVCVDWGPSKYYNVSIHCPREEGLPPLGKNNLKVFSSSKNVMEEKTTGPASDQGNSSNSTNEMRLTPFITEQFIKSMVDDTEAYLGDNCGGGDPSNLNWEFPSAVFFIITIVTTIGYGTFAPTTDAGKAFTVIYAFIGIAYFGVVVGKVGHVVVEGIKATAKCCCHRKRKGYKLNGKKTLM